MGWSKQSSGLRYDSLSRHAALIGANTEKVVDVAIFCSRCCVIVGTGDCEHSEKVRAAAVQPQDQHGLISGVKLLTLAMIKKQDVCLAASCPLREGTAS